MAMGCQILRKYVALICMGWFPSSVSLSCWALAAERPLSRTFSSFPRSHRSSGLRQGFPNFRKLRRVCMFDCPWLSLPMHLEPPNLAWELPSRARHDHDHNVCSVDDAQSCTIAVPQPAAERPVLAPTFSSDRSNVHSFVSVHHTTHASSSLHV